MIHKLSSLMLAAALCAVTAGCNTTPSSVGTSIASGINSITGALTSPQATQALTNLEAGATAIICNVATDAATVEAVETAIASGNVASLDPKSPLAKTYEVTSTVLTISTAVCGGLKGTVGGQAYVATISNGVANASAVGATK